MKLTFQSAAISSLVLFVYAILGLSAQAQITIMPMGDSITVGDDYNTDTAGGYRDPLYHDLVASGISFTFVGVNTSNATTLLTQVGQTNHNGYGAYRIDGILNNLNGNVQPVSADGNLGGYWLTGGNGTGRGPVTPTIILLQIGTNDILQHYDSQTSNPTESQFLSDLEARLNTLVTTIHSLTSNTIVMVAGITPIYNSSGFNTEIQTYNSYIKNTLVPSLSYTRFVDNNSIFLNSDGSVNSLLLGTDDIHPNRYGYPLIAESWAAALRTLEGSHPTTYALTVGNGTGGGFYPAGTVVTVNSNTPPGGQQFLGWSPASTALDNPFWPIATYTTPAASTNVAATYAATGSPIIPNGTYNIVSGSFQFSWFDGLSIGATGTTSGSLAQTQTYTGAISQQWTLTNLGNNVVELSLPGTSNALAVVGGSTNGNANIDVEAYTGATSQQWTITPILGTFEITNVKSGQVINILGYQSQPGIQLVQSTAGYQANQLWAFFQVGAVPAVTSTDTPVMPPIGYAIMAVLFLGIAVRYLHQKRPA